MGGDIKGGGLNIYESNPNINPSLTFGEGLRVPKPHMQMELDGLAATATMGKSKGYVRVRNLNIQGTITHFRSNATQWFNFHFMFGGFKKAYLERYLFNFWFKVFIKRVGPLYAFLWTMQVVSHLDYDTNAYCYFYFSD